MTFPKGTIVKAIRTYNRDTIYGEYMHDRYPTAKMKENDESVGVVFSGDRAFDVEPSSIKQMIELDEAVEWIAINFPDPTAKDNAVLEYIEEFKNAMKGE